MVIEPKIVIEENRNKMSRVSFRYAIEKFDETIRKQLMKVNL